MIRVVVASLVLALTSCASSKDHASGDKIRPLPDQPGIGHDTRVRAELLGLFDGAAIRMSAEEELVRRCMEKDGFNYLKQDPPARDVNPTFGVDDYGIPLNVAKSIGYEVEAELKDSPKADTESQVNHLPLNSRKRWEEAYFGAESAPQITVRSITGQEIQISSEGCLSSGRRTLYGSLKEWLRLDNFAGNFALVARSKAATDGKSIRLDAAWSSCMSLKGFPGLASPSAARARAADLHFRHGIGTKAASAAEKAIAVADSECEIHTEYARSRRAIEDQYYLADLQNYSAEIAALRKLNAVALVRARRIVGQGHD